MTACPPTGNTASARNGNDPVFDRASVWPAPDDERTARRQVVMLAVNIDDGTALERDEGLFACQAVGRAGHRRVRR